MSKSRENHIINIGESAKGGESDMARFEEDFLNASIGKRLNRLGPSNRGDRGRYFRESNEVNAARKTRGNGYGSMYGGEPEYAEDFRYMEDGRYTEDEMQYGEDRYTRDSEGAWDLRSPRHMEEGRYTKGSRNMPEGRYMRETREVEEPRMPRRNSRGLRSIRNSVEFEEDDAIGNENLLRESKEYKESREYRDTGSYGRGNGSYTETRRSHHFRGPEEEESHYGEDKNDRRDIYEEKPVKPHKILEEDHELKKAQRPESEESNELRRSVESNESKKSDVFRAHEEIDKMKSSSGLNEFRIREGMKVNEKECSTRTEIVRGYGTIEGRGVLSEAIKERLKPPPPPPPGKEPPPPPPGKEPPPRPPHEMINEDIEFKFCIYKEDEKCKGEIYFVNYDTKTKIASNSLIYFNNEDKRQMMAIFHVISDDQKSSYQVIISARPTFSTSEAPAQFFAYIPPICHQGLNIGGDLQSGEIISEADREQYGL